jgi:(1->4)-alpha-D-glucan 1-alpha-D-glucosylmutase
MSFRATYRLQLGGDMTFARAAELVPYLAELGVSHLYLSPSFAAREGSTHGYDVVDPTRVSDALGGEDGLRALAATAREAGLGLLLDIVPNHMAADAANPYWADEKRRARFFDLDAATGRHRRFFDIDHLAGVRQEDPEVFAETHSLALRLVGEGIVDGLRVDHPDGLADPACYLERLRAGGAAHVWVEKILDPGEPLRDWPVEGTVGYEFLVDVTALFTDPEGEAPITALWEELSGDARPFGAWALDAKREQVRGPFAADAGWLARLWPGVDGLAEALVSLPVYRTYVRDLPAREDLRVLREAGILEWFAQAPKPFKTRFQQTTPPVMAKGVEDTAFYRYARLLAHNDVGGDPGRWSLDVDAFHAGNAERGARFPRHLLAATTHDTKRSHDVRARIAALASLGEEWAARVRRWRELCAPLRHDDPPAPDPVEEHTIFQTVLGAWPIDADRLCAYMEKAMRERKVRTSWVEPDTAHEERVLAYCRALLELVPFRADFDPFVERAAALGELHALRQTALRLTVPGVPDIYQGDELVALSLVDPDNRRPVDWPRRAELLAELRGGAAPMSPDARKLFLIRALLALRARRAAAFDGGSYTPLDAGPDAVAFLRGEDVAVALPVREGGLEEALLALPDGDWRPAFDPELLPGASIRVLERD